MTKIRPTTSTIVITAAIARDSLIPQNAINPRRIISKGVAMLPGRLMKRLRYPTKPLEMVAADTVPVNMINHPTKQESQSFPKASWM